MNGILKTVLLATLLVIAADRAALAQQYYWSNLAGTPGGSGSLDGIGVAGKFNNPRSVAVDGNGNMYVADSSNHTIRKVTAAGVVTTLAGSPGISGTSDGVGSSARFTNPSGVTVDGSGNVYVADMGNYTIRKVTSDGTVMTLAGNPGQYGVTDGIGNAALFGSPASVAADGIGNVYVADSVSHTIRKVTSAGVVTTFAGTAGQIGTADGVGNDARFNQPNGVAVGGDGDVYVADTFNHTIRKISPACVVTTLAGNPVLAGFLDGKGTLGMFNFPQSVTVDGSGNVYVADTLSHTIRKVTAAGVVTTLAGSVGVTGISDGIGTTAQFNTPCGLAADGSGNVYVADSNNHTIRKVTADWGAVTTFAGSVSVSGTTNGTGRAARFRFPNGVGVDANGNVYVADTNNHTIRNVTTAGMVTTLAGATVGLVNGNGIAALFNNPYGITVTSSSNMYVADTFNNLIRQVTLTSGTWVTTTVGGLVVTGSDWWGKPLGGSAGKVDGAGTGGPGPVAQFSNPSGVAADNSGNLYITDTYNHTIRQMALSGTVWAVTTLSGSSQQSGTTDGVGCAARFSSPLGVAVDSGSNVYLADCANHTIRKMTFSGTNWAVTTLAGSPGVSGTADGTGSAARFSSPAGLAVDSGSNVYVADSGNNTIRKVRPDGTVVTIGGIPGLASGADGLGRAALFYAPCGVAVDGSGNIYIADTGNNRISVGSQVVGSGSASLVTGTGATVSGAASPNGVDTNVHFQYGTTTSYGSVTSTQAIGSGPDFVAVNGILTGLTANTTYHYRLVVVNANGTFYGTDQMLTTPPIVVPTITSAATVTGTKGLVFSNYQIAASNSATAFGANGLPAGLVINPVTGIIAGAPMVSGTFAVILSASNVVGAGTKTLTISLVNMALPSFTSGATASGDVGCKFTYTITATPYVTSFSATGLPSGLGLNTVTGVISGTALTSGTFPVTISAANVSGTSTKTLTLTISPSYYWKTFAGKAGLAGTADGTDGAGLLYSPCGVAVDSSGNVYVADTYKSTVRKVTPAGSMTTLAGSPGLSGTADGTGGIARFNYPYSIAVDSGSNIYVADTNNHSIRKITPDGTVTTLAGLSGSYGSVNATGAAARFFYPQGVAVDSGSTVYVADGNNYTIRKISPDGVVTTFAGTAGTSGSTDGTGAASRFSKPYSVAVDSAKNVYVADRNSCTIRKITTGGVVTTIAGSAGSPGNIDGAGSVARFYYPSGISVDSGGSVYVADTNSSTIRKLTFSETKWMVITIGGTPYVTGTSDGAGSSGLFCNPYGVAVSGAGNVYIADNPNSRISMGTSQLPPAITSALAVSGTAGLAFTYAITASNSPTSYNAVGLPPGLSIDTSTGLISGTTLVSGSFPLTISAANLGGPDTATLALIIRNAYNGWKTLKFTAAELSNAAISDDTAAPAGDGISNLMKYALNLEPKIPSINRLPSCGAMAVGGTNYLTLTYTPTPLASDIIFSVEVTGDLQTWNSGPGFTSLVDTGTASTVTVRDTTPVSIASKRFIRLKVTKP